MTPGVVMAALLVVAVLLGLFAIENHYGKAEEAWQDAADELGE